MQICKIVDAPLSVSDELSLADDEVLSGDDFTHTGVFLVSYSILH
jgi:hypothetical protein